MAATHPTLPLAILLVCALGLACAGKRPAGLGVSQDGLAPCPSSPNCVSSDASDAPHRIDALALAAAPDEAWAAIRQALGEWPRTVVVQDDGTYLHAECTSRLFRFVDDLELHLRPDAGVVAVRSASRVGRSDLGANRRRVEELRAELQARGAVR